MLFFNAIILMLSLCNLAVSQDAPPYESGQGVYVLVRDQPTSDSNRFPVVDQELIDLTQAFKDANHTDLVEIDLNTDDLENRVGAINETPAASDTDSVGLNGLIKRLLQRLTTLINFYASNFGADSAGIRVNSQVGNSTGPADWDNGAPTAQTLRVAASIFDHNGAAFTLTNPLAVIISNTPPGSVGYRDNRTTTSLSGGANTNHTYTMASDIRITHLEVSASGLIKAEIFTSANCSTFTSIGYVRFTATGIPILYDFKTNLDILSGQCIRVNILNRELATQNVYSTIEGYSI